MNARNILVIDDNPYLLEAYQLILTHSGYSVTTLSTGKDALNFICCLQPHLVILDMTLDGYDGRDICNSLKQEHAVKDIPVVIVSGNHPIERYISGRCKPERFLEKPFEIDELIFIIEDELEKAG